ncbi:MAG: response regulator [Bacteroidota bacterium]
MQTILIIEDEQPLREAIGDILKFEGYSVIDACSGEEGLELALQNFPDLILCDIILPGISGYEVLKMIRTSQSLSLTPFIFLTALGQKAHMRQGMEMGADDFLSKPFIRTDLLKSISARFLKADEVHKKDEYAADLELINRELSEFAYMVSHDLKAPIRIIEMFSQFLATEYADKIDSRGMGYIQTIRNYSDRMNQLIDGLLLFSRQRKSEISRQVVNIRKLVQDILDELTLLDKLSRTSIKIDDMPHDYCDEIMIKQVFINLINNAIKFSSGQDNPVVEIESLMTENELTYLVKDNGVGFDTRLIDKLFGVFQRLHPEKDFEGIGIGLAIVKEIIEKHGGRVWARGVVSEGAQFYFTLP